MNGIPLQQVHRKAGYMFIREKKVDCQDYREVDVIPRTDNAEKAVKGKRGKRQKVTEPKQKDLNDKNARRYLVQLGNGNFHIGDLHVSGTYDDSHLPATVEEAERIAGNYLRRIAYRREKLGLEPLKYILVTEYKFAEDGSTLKRVHHHIIMNGGMDRDDVELMWTAKRINWKKAADPEYRAKIKQMGWVNADRLQMNENGIEGLLKYITKDPQGKKRYSSSRNLERPQKAAEDHGRKDKAGREMKYTSSRNLARPVEHPPADSVYSRKMVERLAKSPDGGKEFFQKRFPNYNIVSIEPVFYQETGWHIYLKMWRKKEVTRKNDRRRKRKGTGPGPR